MTAQNMTYPHTNDAHRHHLLTKFTSLFFTEYILVGSRLYQIATLHRQIPSISLLVKNIMAARTHIVSLYKLVSLIPPAQQPQITCRYSRSFLQRLGYYTHSSQLPDLITSPKFRLSTSPPSVRTAQNLQQPAQFSYSNTYTISTSSPTGRPLRRFSCTSS